MPRVAVLMAAYNADATIHQAVRSVLANTYPVDLFIADDASRVPVSEILHPLPPRTEIIRLAANVGPAEARNIALRRILPRNYDYVAIADADDVCYPERIAKQVAFLEMHKNVAVVGSWVHFTDEITGETVFDLRPSSEPALVRKSMFSNLQLSHTSCTIRSATLARVGLYSLAYPAAEDYELMRRIAVDHDISNIPEFLMDYRISSRGISIVRRRRQLVDRLRIQLKYFEPLQWRAWVGVARTLLLFFVPLRLLITSKGYLRSLVRFGGEAVGILRPLLQSGDLIGKVWGRRFDAHNQ